MKKFIKILAALLFLIPSIVSAQQYLLPNRIPLGTGTYFSTSTPNFVYSTTTNRLTITGDSSVSGISTTTTLCLAGDTCRTTWPTSGGSGSGTVSTSTIPTVGQLPYWTSNGYPSLLGSVATGTISGAGGVTVTAGQSIIGSGLTVTCTGASAGATGCLSSTDWSTFNGKQAAGNYITALTGDVTASGPGSSAATLATVNSNVGSFTNANITVNGKGLITAASNGSAGTGTVGTSTNEVSGRVPFWTTNSATPALLGGDSAFTWDNTLKKLGFTYASTTALTVSGTNGLSIGSLTGPLQGINGAVSASSTLSVAYGGTGLSTIPSFGQVLVGNATGGYTLTATTSLGLPWTVSGTNIYNSNSGNVGVGTSTPWANLSIGTVNQSITSPAFLIASSSTGVATTTQLIVVNGKVGIASTTPFAKLSVTNSPGITSTPIFDVATTTSGGVTTDIFQIDGSGNVTMGQSGVYANSIKFLGTTGSAYYGTVGSGNDPGDGPYVGITSSNEDIRLVSGARSTWEASGGSRDSGVTIKLTNQFTAASARALVVSGNSAASSGSAAGLALEDTWATTGGTANTSDILITRTDTSLNATAKNDFIRGVVGSTDKFRVFNDGGGYYAGKLGMGTTTPNATSYTFGSIGRAPRNCSIGCTISATADAEIRVTNTSAPRTITLPTCDGSTLGNEYGVKDSSGGAATNNITVARAGSDTIDGATSKVISTNYGYFRFYCGIAGAWDIH